MQLVDTYGPDEIISAVDRLSPEDKAQVTVSTAHKAKGREWPSVRIGRGFMAPSVDDEGLQRALNVSEARLIYVAITRARHLLDTEGIAWIDEYEKTAAGAGRDGTVAGRPMIELSLTGQLKYDSSPISQFMAAHLPYSENLARDYQARIAGLPYPVQPIDVQYPNWPALGHAIDYRLRLRLGGQLGLAAAARVVLLDEHHPLPGAPADGALKALHVAGRELLATIDAYLADPGSLDENTLIRLCFVAGFFEDIARTGGIRRFSMLGAATPATTLDDLTAAVPE
ncbi:ATP-binding domain-containing protein [Streptomyces laurentii]|uniref:ATP-binding domain-containing protein n=1 Tax=Streptomyces laurentii TaxID=39478 RepID=UPI00367A9CD2